MLLQSSNCHKTGNHVNPFLMIYLITFLGTSAHVLNVMCSGGSTIQSFFFFENISTIQSQELKYLVNKGKL